MLYQRIDSPAIGNGGVVNVGMLKVTGRYRVYPHPQFLLL